jgi:phage shock protein E
MLYKKWLLLIGIIAGATTGFMYGKWVGCSSGSCVITSKPLNTAVYGAVMGGLLFSTLKRK